MMDNQTVDCGPGLAETDEADTATSCGGTSEGPPRLSREFILDTAIALIDRHGLPSLTMRRLGAACGVEAMALYRHVRGRGDLLNGVVDHVIDRLYTDQLSARRQED